MPILYISLIMIKSITPGSTQIERFLTLTQNSMALHRKNHNSRNSFHFGLLNTINVTPPIQDPDSLGLDSSDSLSLLGVHRGQVHRSQVALQQSDAGLGDGHGEAEDGQDEEEVKRA